MKKHKKRCEVVRLCPKSLNVNTLQSHILPHTACDKCEIEYPVKYNSVRSVRRCEAVCEVVKY